MNNLVSIKTDGSKADRDSLRGAVATDNLVSINRNKVLGTYINAQERKRIPEEVYFAGGVIFSLALPQVICSLYGGSAAAAALAGSSLAGLILGVVRYRRSPYRPGSFFGLGTMPQVSPGTGLTPRKAA